MRSLYALPQRVKETLYQVLLDVGIINNITVIFRYDADYGVNVSFITSTRRHRPQKKSCHDLRICK